MDDGEKSKGSWWQTAPGILTAIAGTITAVAGLLVTLQQIGLLGNKEKSAVQSPSSDNVTANRSEVTALTATPYLVTFPSGTEVTLRSSRSDGTYKILEAKVESQNAGKFTLTISVRLTNTGRSDLGFGSDSFRLVIDGIPRAPKNFLNELVDARSAKEGDVMFEVPNTAKSLVLSVTGDGGDTADIPILLKKSH